MGALALGRLALTRGSPGPDPPTSTTFSLLVIPGDTKKMCLYFLNVHDMQVEFIIVRVGPERIRVFFFATRMCNRYEIYRRGKRTGEVEEEENLTAEEAAHSLQEKATRPQCIVSWRGR